MIIFILFIILIITLLLIWDKHGFKNERRVKCARQFDGPPLVPIFGNALMYLKRTAEGDIKKFLSNLNKLFAPITDIILHFHQTRFHYAIISSTLTEITYESGRSRD